MVTPFYFSLITTCHEFDFSFLFSLSILNTDYFERKDKKYVANFDV